MMPDYGCPVQAWTIYGLSAPLVTHVFGIHPDAYNKEINFSPNLPSKWNSISITNLPVGKNSVSFTVDKSENKTTYKILSKDTNWKYTLTVKVLAGKKYFLNGKNIAANSDKITMGGKENTVVAPDETQ